MIPAMDFLSCYAIAVNEVNAGGGFVFIPSFFTLSLIVVFLESHRDFAH